MILNAKKVPLITPSKEVKGEEIVVFCPKDLCKVNVKKNCGKCLGKKKISLKTLEVDCKYADRLKDLK